MLEPRRFSASRSAWTFFWNSLWRSYAGSFCRRKPLCRSLMNLNFDHVGATLRVSRSVPVLDHRTTRTAKIGSYGNAKLALTKKRITIAPIPFYSAPLLHCSIAGDNVSCSCGYLLSSRMSVKVAPLQDIFSLFLPTFSFAILAF